MTFFFSWLKKPVPFDPKAHAKPDMQVLSFSISHSEGEAALLKMNVPSYKSTPLRYGVLSYAPNKNTPPIPLFLGTLCHFPLRLKQHVWQLEFRSHINDDSFKHAQSLLKEHVNSHFLKQKDSVAPSDYLETSPHLFQFDRVTGECIVSNIFQGQSKLTPRNVFDDSVKVTYSEVPLSHVDVEVSASWTQEDRGEVDIAPKAAKAFAGGIVNTLTPKAFAARFPKEGQKLGERRGRSGCRVVESMIEEVLPPTTGSLDLYPRTSPTLWKRNHGSVEHRPITLKRTYFQTKLVVEWHYLQSRMEVIRVRVRNAMPSPAFRPGKTLRYDLLHLPKLKGTFFKTEEGLQALEHAVKRAKAHLAVSARCIEITFRMPFDEGTTLTLDQAVNVRGILHLKRDVFAKVIGYELNRMGNSSYCEVRCALSFGMNLGGEAPTPYGIDLPKGNTAATTYVSDVPALYDEVRKKLQPRGVLETHTLNTLDLVEHVEVLKPPEDQIKKLIASEDLDQTLQQNPTQVAVRLKDLRTQELLVEDITLSEQSYAPPPLISLDEIEED